MLSSACSWSAARSFTTASYLMSRHSAAFRRADEFLQHIPRDLLRRRADPAARRCGRLAHAGVIESISPFHRAGTEHPGAAGGLVDRHVRVVGGAGAIVERRMGETNSADWIGVEHPIHFVAEEARKVIKGMESGVGEDPMRRVLHDNVACDQSLVERP